MDESRDVLRGLLQHPDLGGIPTLVFANKQDAPGAVTPHEVQARFGLQTVTGHDSASQPTNVLGVVSLSGEGVEDGIIWLVDVLRSGSGVPRSDGIGRSGGAVAGWDRV